MSAVDSALSVFQHGRETAPWLFFTEIYGGTNSYVDSVLIERRGINIIRFSPDGESYNMSKFRDIVSRERPSLIFFEVISNPMLIVTNPAEVVSVAREFGAAVIIDNTFATPYLLNPLEMGADLVIHSATKYLGGHGNITAGAICEKLRRSVTDYRKFTGHMLSADDAYRLTTQMESFSLRVKQQFRNAIDIADLLSKSDAVERVIFPGLETHPTANAARTLFGDRGFGAIITFDLSGASSEEKRRNRDVFIREVSERIRLVPSLGDSHTILMPVEPVWGYKYEEPGMIRLSVGFEDEGDIPAVIKRALSSI